MSQPADVSAETEDLCSSSLATETTAFNPQTSSCQKPALNTDATTSSISPTINVSESSRSQEPEFISLTSSLSSSSVLRASFVTLSRIPDPAPSTPLPMESDAQSSPVPTLTTSPSSLSSQPSNTNDTTSFKHLGPVYLAVGIPFVLVLLFMIWILMLSHSYRPCSCLCRRKKEPENIQLRQRGPGDAYEIEPRMWTYGGRLVGESTSSRSWSGRSNSDQRIVLGYEDELGWVDVPPDKIGTIRACDLAYLRGSAQTIVPGSRMARSIPAIYMPER